MSIFNRFQTFATNGTVDAASLHNLIDATTIRQGLITSNANITSVGTNYELLIADTTNVNANPNAVTVYDLFEDALTAGTYTNANISAALTYGTATGTRLVSTNATITTGTITTGVIPTLTAGTTTSTAATITSGTITNLASTTGTIGNLSTTLAGDFTISSGTGTLGTTGVTAGTYGDATSVPVLTLDTKGRVTTVSTSAITTGFRNRIINGDMRIDQRNAGANQTFTAAAALAYSVDRFYGYCTGANVTGARVAGAAPNEFAYQFTGAASVTEIGFGTRLEATNTTDLAGSTATLSVQLANSLLTTVTWTAFRADTTDAFGTLASPTRTQIGTGTFTVTSTLTTYSAQISVPSAATTGIEIVFTVGAQTSGTWTIDNVQLESGLSFTSFERRPIGTELGLCQRYLPAFSATTTTGPLPGIATALITNAAFVFNHPVPARVQGSGVVVSANTHFSFSNNDGNSSSTAVSFAAGSPNTSQLVITVAVSRGATTTPGWIFANNASAYLYITGCEL